MFYVHIEPIQTGASLSLPFFLCSFSLSASMNICWTDFPSTDSFLLLAPFSRRQNLDSTFPFWITFFGCCDCNAKQAKAMIVGNNNNNNDGRQRHRWTNKKNNGNNIIETLHVLEPSLAHSLARFLSLENIAWIECLPSFSTCIRVHVFVLLFCICNVMHLFIFQQQPPRIYLSTLISLVTHNAL